MRKEALWPWLELGTSGIYLVLDKPFRLEPIWAALSRAETVVQPSPAVLADFLLDQSQGVLQNALFTDEKCLRLDLAATQRAYIEDLLKYTYFIEA